MKTRKFKGFTLIELIVVIAIIGILAAILVPAMMGWILKARVTTCNNNASEVCTQLQTAVTDLDTQGDLNNLRTCTVICLNGDFTQSNPAPAAGSVEEKALTDVNKSLTDMNGVNWAADIVQGEVRSVVLTMGGGSVGGFPIQCPAGSDFKKDPSAAIEIFLPCADGSKTWLEVH